MSRVEIIEKIEKSEKAIGRREEIIRATYNAFNEKPSAEVTLQDIADEAGFSKGVVMYYFKSKEEVFVALLEWLLARIEKRIVQNVGAAEGARAKLRAMLDSIFLSARDNRRFYVVYLDFTSQGSRNGMSKFPTFRNTNVRFFEVRRQVDREIIALGVSEGIYRDVALDEASSVIGAIIHGLCMQWLFDDSASPEETFERYKAWAISSIEAYLAIR